MNEWLPLNTPIDLGNRNIELISLPGHTDESVIVVDHSNKFIFTGDYIYNGELYVFGNAGLAIYEQSVDYLLANFSSDYRLFGAHGTPEVSYYKLQDLKDLLMCIGSGNCPYTVTTVFGEIVWAYSLNGMDLWVFQ